MACRISKKVFLEMAQEEAGKLGLNRLAVVHTEPRDYFDMAEVTEPPGSSEPTAHLNRKAIQSLVDEAEQARPIIRNLLRWAKEHGARALIPFVVWLGLSACATTTPTGIDMPTTPRHFVVRNSG